MNINFLSTTLIGLDIQPHKMRLLKLKKHRRGFHIENGIARDLPTDIFKDGKIKRWNDLSSIIKECVDEHGFNGDMTAIGLPANLVRMQRIRLPSGLSALDIEAEIYSHLQRDLPGMTDALCIDFTELPEKETGYSTIVLTAARQEYVTNYTECIHHAGLQVKIVDVDIYALQRAVFFTELWEVKRNDVKAILSIIDDIVMLILFDAKEIIFHQQWSRDKSTNLAEQVKQRIQFCLETVRDVHLRCLYLCGLDEHQTLEQTLITEFMQTNTCQILSINPMLKMKKSVHVVSSMHFFNQSDFLIACGLAMREVPKW